MILLVHIAFALLSVALATYLLFNPSRSLFLASYGLIGGTLSSGTALILTDGSHLLQACLSGIAYTSVIAILTVRAHRRLAFQASRIR